MKRQFATLFLIGLATAAVLNAHDPSKHKGRPTKGEIVSISEDRLELKTDKGTTKVLLTEKPKIERGDTVSSIADLKKGQQVTVFGTTLASGEVVAREIVVAGGATRKRGHPPSEGGHSSHGH